MKSQDLLEFDTKLTADVVEWRPLGVSTNLSGKILACGTYFLEKEQKKRLGSIYTMCLNDEFNKIESLNQFSFDSSGILDFRWLNESNLLTIDSNNQISLFDYNESRNDLTKLESLKLNEDNSIGLTIDYFDLSNKTYKCLTSDTLGFLNLINLDNERFSLTKSFKAHDLEVWSVLIDKSDENMVYSGADDCKFKMWDLRANDLKPSSKCELIEGGVTNILLPYRNNVSEKNYLKGFSDNQILCSSYDERIYVLDKRNMKSCLKKSDKLGGGVWKMKLHFKEDILLTACMHHGVNLVDSDLNQLFHYEKHGVDNLAYGCDWNPSHDCDRVIATCSFYNHMLRIWKI